MVPNWIYDGEGKGFGKGAYRHYVACEAITLKVDLLRCCIGHCRRGWTQVSDRRAIQAIQFCTLKATRRMPQHALLLPLLKHPAEEIEFVTQPACGEALIPSLVILTTLSSHSSRRTKPHHDGELSPKALCHVSFSSPCQQPDHRTIVIPS